MMYRNSHEKARAVFGRLLSDGKKPLFCTFLFLVDEGKEKVVGAILTIVRGAVGVLAVIYVSSDGGNIQAYYSSIGFGRGVFTGLSRFFSYFCYSEKL